MTYVLVVLVKSINSVVDLANNRGKRVTGLVELDQFKYTLNTYRKPLLEVGDSL